MPKCIMGSLPCIIYKADKNTYVSKGKVEPFNQSHSAIVIYAQEINGKHVFKQ